MSTVTVWTLTVDDGGGVATTVHPSEAAAMITLRDNYSELDLPADDGELVDYLTHSTWEGGPGVVFYIEAHDLDLPAAEPATDPFAAITEIRRLAAAANVAVSVVTVADVLMLKGVKTEPTAAQAEAVVDSYEWRHWGENWPDWFEGVDLTSD